MTFQTFTKPTQLELADLANLSLERVREFGSVYLVLAQWRKLGVHELLSELMGEWREDVPWAEVAAVLTAGKFCGQAPELGVAVSSICEQPLRILAASHLSSSMMTAFIVVWLT